MCPMLERRGQNTTRLSGFDIRLDTPTSRLDCVALVIVGIAWTANLELE